MANRRNKRQAAVRPTSLDLPTTVFCAAGLLVLAFVAFAPALRNGFVNWDDGPYIVINRSLNDLSGLRSIWEPEFLTHILGQFGIDPPAYQTPIYYPLVFTSFWIERQLGVHEFGKGYEVDRVWGNHAINMFIHALAGILLWRCLVKLRMPAGWAWLASAIWIVHPLQVESVVWAVERKNTLSGLFYFASALMYLRADTHMRSKSYLAAVFLFLCMMLSKTAFVALPVTLLSLEWLRGRRIGRAALLRVTPFFAIGVLLALTMVSSEKTVVIVETLTARLMIAGHAFWFYLYKFLWPLHAITIYPRWDTTVTALKMIPLAGALAAGMVWLVTALRRKPEKSVPVAVVLIAVAQYVASVGPALGVVGWPHMDRSFVANHFVYVPLVGPIVLLVLGLRRLVQRAKPRRSTPITLSLAAVLLIVLSAYSFKRSMAWRNNGTLVADILAVNPDCPEAHALRSIELQASDGDAALAEMQWVIDHKPRYPQAQLQLARMLVVYRNDLDGAIEHYRAAIKMQPELEDGYVKLAQVLMRAGRYDEALSAIEQVSERLGREAGTLAVKAKVLCGLKRWGEAIEVCERLLRIQPRAATAYLYRGRGRLGLGDRAAAERDFKTALKLNPKLAANIDDIRRRASRSTSQPVP